MGAMANPIQTGSRSLSDLDHSAAANDLQPSAAFSARKNPQRIPANTPPVFPGLRSCIWLHLLRLVTKAMSDRLLATLYPQARTDGRDKFEHSPLDVLDSSMLMSSV
jgi:hypothetical protein